jgi:hypothetical protein
MRLAYFSPGVWLAERCGWLASYSQCLAAIQAWPSSWAPLPEALFILSVLTAIRSWLIGARDLIIDSAPILAWRRADPDAAYGHAPAQHPRGK